jgi:hypothetical protein
MCSTTEATGGARRSLQKAEGRNVRRQYDGEIIHGRESSCGEVATIITRKHCRSLAATSASALVSRDQQCGRGKEIVTGFLHSRYWGTGEIPPRNTMRVASLGRPTTIMMPKLSEARIRITDQNLLRDEHINTTGRITYPDIIGRQHKGSDEVSGCIPQSLNANKVKTMIQR